MLSFKDIGAHPLLVEHSEEFNKPEVINVTDGVYVAIGFGIANSVLIEGDDGVIIVDTLGSAEAASQAKAEFDKITSKPVKAIIYTHNHGDHIFGAGVFAGDDNPEVYSHETTTYYVDRIFNVLRPVIGRRSMRQFGTYLHEGGLVNAGLGPFLEVRRGSTLAFIRPTKTFADRLEVEIAGVKLELIHAPGETNDQIYVSMPEKKCVISADNIYKTFPNLYAIRGTAYRDVMNWVHSLDILRALRPDYLVPCHTRPIIGADEIYGHLTDYRDAIQYIHDHTVRGMNQGLLPDEIVERVKLPPHLAQSRYLREHYGTVAWSVRTIFDGYVGWFSGNPTDLHPLPPLERAERVAKLAGGVENLRQQAHDAVADEDYQWALELTDHLLRLNPDDDQIRPLRIQALVALGEQHISPCGRNYYLMSAQELDGFSTPPLHINVSFARAVPLSAIFQTMAIRLNPEKSANVNMCVGFRFPDTEQTYTVHVRYGVAEIQPTFPPAPDVTITVDAPIWKEIAARVRNPMEAFASGEIKIEGNLSLMPQFLSLFR
ncbi:MAG: alkyl/aryl-sulfatase [Ardenticatenaceae bacterium]